MEYLEDISEKLNDIDEKGIIYYNLFDFSELFYGTLNFAFDRVDFSKFPDYILEPVKKDDEENYGRVKKLNNSTMGCRLKFKTNSKKIILKIELENHFLNIDVPVENSRGFEVNYIENDRYIPLTVFAPENDEKIFAECICTDENEDFCIFLPNYDCIKRIYAGIESDSDIVPSPYIGENKKPIVFYGSGISQGISVSKNACTYPNIISKNLDQDIINLSVMENNFSTDIAEYMGHINCQSIVLDCSTVPINTTGFEESFNEFYMKLRQFHKNIPIIILTTPVYREKNNQIDDIINNIIEKAKNNNENTIIINQKHILSDVKEGSNDTVMYKLAKSIIQSLKKN